VVFLSGFPTDNLYTFLLSPIRTKCTAHLILLDLINLIILGKEYKSCSYLLCSFLHTPIMSSHFGPPSPGMWHCVPLVRTKVSEEHITSIIWMKRISELGTTSAITSNQLLTLFLVHWFFSARLWRPYVSPKRHFLQEPHSVTSQETAFFIIGIFSVWGHVSWGLANRNEISKWSLGLDRSLVSESDGYYDVSHAEFSESSVPFWKMYKYWHAIWSTYKWESKQHWQKTFKA
jgi:hypothetical protein